MKKLIPNSIASDIFNDLRTIVPQQAHLEVKVSSPIGQPLIRIILAASDKLINNVEGQYPQKVVLTLFPQDLDLQTNSRAVYRKPREETKEQYYAMVAEKIPFRRPKQELPKVREAITRFATRWLDTMRGYKDELMYNDLVDYESLLS